MTTYIYRDHEVFVSKLPGKATYGTVFKAKNGGALHRIKHEALPERETEQEAISDLKEWAETRKLHVVGKKGGRRKSEDSL